jgi:hypothetical protein
MRRRGSLPRALPVPGGAQRPFGREHSCRMVIAFCRDDCPIGCCVPRHRRLGEAGRGSCPRRPDVIRRLHRLPCRSAHRTMGAGLAGRSRRERHGRMPDRAASGRRSIDRGGRSAVLRDSAHCCNRHVAGSHAGTGISWLRGYRRVPSAACRLLALENPFGSDAGCLRGVRAGLWPVSAVHGFSFFLPRPVRTAGGDCALCLRGKRPPGRLLGNCRGRRGAWRAGSSRNLAIASANVPQSMKEVLRFIAACGLMALA